MPPPPGSVAAYLRVSIDRTGEAVNTARQAKRARELARQHRLPTPVDYLEPGSTSASKPRGKKSAYAQLLKDVRAGRIRVVIVWDIDRFLRRPDELEEWLKMCDEGEGVRIVTMDGEIDTATPNGRLFLRIKVSVARHEVEHKAARQRDANRDRAEAGRPWLAGRRTFGLVPDLTATVPDEAEQVAQAFADAAGGTSLRSITRAWNAAGSRSSQGNPWTTAALRLLLANPTYIGRRRYQGVEVADLVGVPIIVDEDTFRAVQVVLADPTRRTSERGGRGPMHLLSGVARCGMDGCGARLSYGAGAGRGGKTYRIIRCRECLRVSRAVDPIEDFVTKAIIERLGRKDAAELFEVPAVDLAPLRKRAGELRDRRKALAADLDVAEDYAAIRDARLRTELVALEAEIAAGMGSSPLAPFAKGDDPLVVWTGLSVDGRREAIRALATVHVHPVGRGRAPFNSDTVKVVFLPRKAA